MKERLIGAAVLVALAVWLIPWLLSGPDDAAQDGPVSLQLPIPEVQTVSLRTEVIDLDAARRPQSAVIALEADERSGASRSAPSGSAASTSVAADQRPATGKGGAAVEGTSAQTAAPTQPVPSPQTSEQQSPRSSSTAAPASSVAADPAPAATRTADSAPASAATLAAPKPASASAAGTAPQGDWAIQLGSFGDEENARRLAERVTTFGFKPQISDYRAGGRTMYRVRVGPQATRAAAEAAASSLSAHGFIAQVVTAD